MAEYIKQDAAIAIIEEKQKELCPVGRYGRGYVYGSDREKYDAWDEIIDALENIPAADVAPVVHGLWMPIRESEMTGWNPAFAGRDPIGGYICSACKEEAVYDCNDEFVLSNYCPNCGAKMDGGADHAPG